MASVAGNPIWIGQGDPKPATEAPMRVRLMPCPRWALWCVLGVSTVGCGKSEDSGTTASNSGVSACGRPASVTAGDSLSCGDNCTLTLTAMSPSAPEKGDNAWTVQVTGPTVVSVEATPFMPEHGHGTSPASFMGVATGEPGTYTVSEMPFFMAGLWEVTVTATDSEDNVYEGIFEHCLED